MSFYLFQNRRRKKITRAAQHKFTTLSEGIITSRDRERQGQKAYVEIHGELMTDTMRDQRT